MFDPTKWIWKLSTGVLAVAFLGVGITSCSLDRELLKAKRQVAELGETLASERAASAAKLAEAKGEALRVQNELQDALNQAKKDLNETVSSLTQQHAAISNRLRNAQAEAQRLRAQLSELSSTSKVAGTGEASSRDNEPLVLATLGQEDVDEALRGDVIREHLLACYAAYDKARNELLKMEAQPP